MLKVGDRVEIVCSGEVYSTYQNWASEHNLKNWEPCTPLKDGDVGVILKIEPHGSVSRKKLIAGVQLEKTGKSTIINLSAIKKLTKKEMSSETMYGVLNEAIVVKNKIKRIEVEVLADLKEHLKQLSEKLMRELTREGLDGASNSDGSVIVVKRKGSIKIDKEALMKDLGLKDLTKYEQHGKSSEFLKYTITKKPNA